MPWETARLPGVGINLAIQDAVAAAILLAKALLTGTLRMLAENLRREELSGGN